jgi:nucleoporin SEH1
VCQAAIAPGLGALWRASWAHPEYGAALALCGEHQVVTVWEEQEAPDHAGRVVSRWNRRAELGDARQSVHDVKFAPRHAGLRLAAASGDGAVRVYEVTDVMNLTHWPLADEFRGDGGLAVTSIAWCPSQFDAAMLAVGGLSGTVRVWGWAPSSRKWLPMLEFARHAGRLHDVAWAPNMGRSYHLIASAGADGLLCVWKLLPDDPTDGESGLGGVGGRGGAAGGGGTASASGGAGGGDAAATVRRTASSTADGVHLATFVDAGDQQPVWRAEWNVSGTVLASVGEDGVVRLRRADARGRWATAGVIGAGDGGGRGGLVEGTGIAAWAEPGARAAVGTLRREGP